MSLISLPWQQGSCQGSSGWPPLLPWRSLRITGFFGVGLLNDARKKILSRPTPVTMATKFETKSAITRLIEEITPRSLRITGGFRRPAIAWRQTNFTTTNPYCHGNEIWEKIGYNSACTLYKRYLWNVCVRQGVFGVGLSNDAKQILQWPTLVAMASKFEIKQAITPLV